MSGASAAGPVGSVVAAEGESDRRAKMAVDDAWRANPLGAQDVRRGGEPVAVLGCLGDGVTEHAGLVRDLGQQQARRDGGHSQRATAGSGRQRSSRHDPGRARKASKA